MKMLTTGLPGVVTLEPVVHSDVRGDFFEIYNRETLDSLGLFHPVEQMNVSRSIRNTIRGLHFQLLKPQAKMVQVLFGSILDVVADIRPDSPTWKQCTARLLNDQNHATMYIPPGYAHGFVVLSSEAVVMYSCDELYSGPNDQHGVRWDDPSLAIAWPAGIHPILSNKDAALPLLCEISPENLPQVLALS
jgi:dTDP-4-dehydrorhamnose 3,5-epimerase